MLRLYKLFSKKTGADNEDLLSSVDAETRTETSIHVNVPLEEENSLPVVANSKSVSSFQIAKYLGSALLAKENLPRLTVATLLTVCSTGLNFLSPYLFGELIKLLSSDDETITIGGIEFNRAALMTALIASYTLAQAVPNFRDQVMVSVASNTTKKIAFHSTDHLLKKSLAYQVETPFSDQGYFMQQSFLMSAIGPPLLTQIAPTLVEIMIACSVLSNRYGIEIGAGLFGLMTAYTGYSAFTAKPLIKLREESLKAGNATYENFCTAIAQYKNMYDLDKYDETIKGVDAALEKLIKADIAANTRPLQFGLGHIGISRISMLLATLYVGLGVKPGKYTIEDFVVLVGYLNQLSVLLPGFGEAVSKLFVSIPGARLVFNEWAKKDEMVDLHPDTPLQMKDNELPSIEFSDVSFAYPTKPGEATKPLLFEHLSFKVKPGQKVALVSSSGAGKSTIFNMLCGYYKPISGAIKINDQDISTVSLKDLRRNIAIFNQTPKLFKGSIRDNIRYGAKNADQITDEEIFDLAKKVNLYDFLQSFPDKLDTDVGDAGQKLSLGQQQKIAILRGLFKKGQIRLFDEITASLDNQSAAEVLECIEALPNNVTSMIITHKLTEIQSVDQIIVLDKGKAIACGTHDELLQTCELYQKLWQASIKKESKNLGSNRLPENTASLSKLSITAAWNQKQEETDNSILQTEVNSKKEKNDDAIIPMETPSFS